MHVRARVLTYRRDCSICTPQGFSRPSRFLSYVAIDASLGWRPPLFQEQIAERSAAGMSAAGRTEAGRTAAGMSFGGGVDGGSFGGGPSVADKDDDFGVIAVCRTVEMKLAVSSTASCAEHGHPVIEDMTLVMQVVDEYAGLPSLDVPGSLQSLFGDSGGLISNTMNHSWNTFWFHAPVP